MNASSPIRGQGGHLGFLISWKNPNLIEDVEVCLPIKFNQIHSAVSEKLKMSPQIRRQGGHLVFTISPKNTNLVKDVEILLPVMFLWILFRGFRGEVASVSANQRPGQPSWFSKWPERHNIGRGPWDLASYQVSSNSVQRFQRKSRKCLSQSEAGAAILNFRLARKTQTW